ncbi:MAG TPA: deoxyhypusine synthase family protein [Candidatus Krumholzibacteria bacterium]|nr:deoxyhypusine synthase family protein [Candidatus Krumholzibacteria bacterium]
MSSRKRPRAGSRSRATSPNGGKARPRRRAPDTAAEPTRPAAGAVAGHVHRAAAAYGTGFDDHLEPTLPLDLGQVSSISDLVRQYGSTAIGARQVGLAADILETASRDPECYVVLTISGAMTVAKMGLVVCDMIEHGMVQAIVATGALMAHGFVEASGLLHFKYDPAMDDEQLFDRGYNRIYDSLELEKNLDDVEPVVRAVLDAEDDGTPWSSVRLHRELGETLARRGAGRGILRSAYEHDVPIYVPAFTDSELGLDFAIHSRRRQRAGLASLAFDPFLDLEDYTGRIEKQKRLAIFTIGGGAPRNWAQQVAPYLDLLHKRAGIGQGMRRFQYAVRICPEPVHWGGLSGCTYSEGVSWGKFVPVSEGGRFAEVYADATIVWPLVVKAVLERLAAAKAAAGGGGERRLRRR